MRMGAASFFKRDAGNPILNTLCKLLQAFSQHARGICLQV